MLTNCKDELPNPHRNCLREILDALIIQHNDFRRMNVELRNLQAEFKTEMQRLEYPCSELRRSICCETYEKSTGESFVRRIGRINEIHDCFKRRIGELETKICETLTNARNCVVALNTEKNNLKRFHERTIDYLKRHAINSLDPKVVANCEKDICEMHKMFVKEVAFTQQVENQLEPFLKILSEKNAEQEGICVEKCKCFKDHQWIPEAKSNDSLDGIINAIKSEMGCTLIKAFTQINIQQPSDVKGYLAGYLMNLVRNEKALQEKMDIFGTTEANVTCEHDL